MLYRYVIYYDRAKDKMLTVRFASSSLACGFVERKIESGTYTLIDFLLIHGKPIKLKETTRKVCVTISG